MSANPGAVEYRLEHSPYGDGTVSLTGNEANARRIQTALLAHGLAGDVKYGLELQSYIGEILDDIEVDDIKRRITAILEKMVPDVTLQALVVERQDDQRTLLVGFTIGAPREEPFSFALQMTRYQRNVVVKEFKL